MNDDISKAIALIESFVDNYRRRMDKPEERLHNDEISSLGSAAEVLAKLYEQVGETGVESDEGKKEDKLGVYSVRISQILTINQGRKKYQETKPLFPVSIQGDDILSPAERAAILAPIEDPDAGKFCLDDELRAFFQNYVQTTSAVEDCLEVFACYIRGLGGRAIDDPLTNEQIACLETARTILINYEYKPTQQKEYVINDCLKKIEELIGKRIEGE